MSKEHIVCRIIDGRRYRCKDTGCDDFDRAEYNRYFVEHNLFLAGYRELEQAVAHTPLNCPFPSWVRYGTVIQVGKKDWLQCRSLFGGGYEELK